MAAQNTDLEQQVRAAKRLLKAKRAHDSLIEFTKFTMPDIEDPDDADKSRYDDQYFHRALAAALEEAEKGNIRRLIITFPPRHGKSELTSRRFPAWVAGRDPYKHVMFGTYNQPFAEDFGVQVRDIINSEQFKTAFPACRLKKGSQSAARLVTEQGGMLAFVGRGGSATGRGADVLIIDDPLKDRAEANSPVVREELWNWFNDTMSTRLMSDTGIITIIMTRWHEDDLVGRLTDPINPHYSKEEAASWKIINIPAIAGDNDVLGREPGAALWPERFGIDYLEAFRRRNPTGFAALYQQTPTPPDGEFFKSEHIHKYRPEDKPRLLRVYAASDHAVGEKQTNDRTCMIVFGVDHDGVIWILDTWWKRANTEEAIKGMLALQRRWKPIIWWAEGGHITKSVGPFLKRRMLEERVFINIREVTPSADKLTRSQSIQARMSQGMVRFPLGTHWLEDAIGELLKFPMATHDDFVDACSLMGLGLDSVHKAGNIAMDPKIFTGPKEGTMAWVKADSDYRKRQERRQFNLGGM